MVFGQRGLREGMEDSGAKDVAGKIPTSLPEPSQSVIPILAEVAAILDNRGMPFYQRMLDALSRLDEGITANPDNTHLHLTRANLRYQNLDYHHAISDFRRIGEILPGEVFQYAPLARMAIDIGDREEASVFIDILAAKDPDDIRVLELKASLLEAGEKSTEAGRVLERILELPIKVPEAEIRNRLATLKLDSDDPQGALDSLAPLIEKGSRNSEVYRLAADALAEMGRKADAKDSYLKSLHHNSGNLKTRFNLGVLLRELAADQKARIEFEIVISANPNDPDASFQLFELDREAGMSGEAFSHALRYLLNTVDPEDDDPAMAYVADPIAEMSPELRILYARYLIDSGETDSAIEMLESEVEDESFAPPFEILLAGAYEDEGRIKEAVEIAETALDRFEEAFDGTIVCQHPYPPYNVEGGDFAELVYRIAGLYLKLGDISEASEALAELPEDDSLAHVGKRIKGEIAFVGGNYDEALELFMAGLKEHPADVDLLASIGAVYGKLGNSENAINYFLRAFMNDKNDAGVIENLARLYIETNLTTRAKLFLNLMLEHEDEEEALSWARNELEKLKS